MESQAPGQQPFLENVGRAGGRVDTNLSRLLNRIMFVFAPVPLESFAEVVAIQLVAGSLFPKLPSYMSSGCKMCIYFILLATHLNFCTWFGQLAATWVVLGSQALDQHHVRKLAYILIFGHFVLGARAFTRLLTRLKLDSKAIKVEDVLFIDIGFWNPMMGAWALNTWRFLHNESVFFELTVSGHFSTRFINFALAALNVASYAWMTDIILRLAWLGIAKNLEKDFQACATDRILSEIKDADYEEECSICLEITSTDACRLPCGHAFHRSCFTHWARRAVEGRGLKGLSCPLCRAVPESIASLSELPLEPSTSSNEVAV